jgi:phage tail sheath protein FI
MRPDVYVVDKPIVKLVDGLSTTVAGFIGITEKGVVNVPQLVTSYSDFLRKFGNPLASSHLSHNVKGFFENGGSLAYVNRVVKYTANAPTATSATKTLLNATSTVVATLKATTEGTWGNSLQVEVVNAVGGAFTLKAYSASGEVDTFVCANLTDLSAQLINHPDLTVTIADVAGVVANLAKTSLAGGADGLDGIADSDYIGTEAIGTGIHAFTNVSVSIMCIPGVTTSAVQRELVTYCSNRTDCVCLVDFPPTTLVSGISDILTTNMLLGDYCIAVYPNIVINDTTTNANRVIPPLGHYAGMIARTDANIGVWKAPAGVNAQLKGAVGLAYVAKSAEREILNNMNVNAIVPIENYGICVMGARTRGMGAGKYINALRTKTLVSNKLRQDLQWVMFENNDHATQTKAFSQAYAFLDDLWKKGGLKGNKANEAFFVKCDPENNPESSVLSGKFNLDVGIATHKPAEFIIIRLTY